MLHSFFGNFFDAIADNRKALQKRGPKMVFSKQAMRATLAAFVLAWFGLSAEAHAGNGYEGSLLDDVGGDLIEAVFLPQGEGKSGALAANFGRQETDPAFAERSGLYFETVISLAMLTLSTPSQAPLK